MKALALDTAASCISIAARNESLTCTIILDIGMHQSERLMPTVDSVLKECGLSVKDLDFVAISIGPGSFTGLRLATAAAKAIKLATGCPIYGISSLDAYAHPYSCWNGLVLATLDAKKHRFYAALYNKGVTVQEAQDVSPEEIALWIENQDQVLITGPDAKMLKNSLDSLNKGLSVFCFQDIVPCATEGMFTIGYNMLSHGKTPMEDYEGPIYLRKSEAEEKKD